jgi:hypothetical protein
MDPLKMGVCMKSKTSLVVVPLMLVLQSAVIAEEEVKQSWFGDVIPPVHGFLEYGHGIRTQSDDRQKHGTIYHETRLQLEMFKRFSAFDIQLKNDITYDAWKGTAEYDLREAYSAMYPLDWLDMKVGRQILTWGTGDFVFINDLFPKDWQSFFIGRDDEYLKAPSDAVRTIFYPVVFDQDVTVDFVWMPYFQHDRFVTGERISYYNTLLDDKAGFKNQVHYEEPDRTFENSVFALRLSKNFSGTETALYFYKGFYPRPLGFDMEAWRSVFPELNVYGGSIRRSVLGGIGNVEVGYYDSQDDAHGDDPLIENSAFKGVVGYTRELKRDLSLGLQYYWEYMSDYDDYRSAVAVHETRADELRQLATVRLTQLMMMQTLKVSLFTFYSPTDEDAYLRPSVSYKWSDNVELYAGGNVFLGREEHTFFGQLEDNTNMFFRIRYSF